MTGKREPDALNPLGNLGSWVLHPEEVAVLDCNAQALGVPIYELMDAAGAALADCAVRCLQKNAKTGPKHGAVCILCGPGNNGGDGYAAAVKLHKQGYPVQIVASSTEQRGAEAQNFREQCIKLQINIFTDTQEKQKWTEQLEKYALVIDCLLGAGFRGGPVRGAIAEILHLCAALQRKGTLPPVLACDLPSGLSTEKILPQNGETHCVHAATTLSFHAAKLPMYGPDGQLRMEVGTLELAALPWPQQTVDCGPGELLRLPRLQATARKGERGRLMIVGGGPYYGAPLLAAQAAGRSGCDLVHLAMPKMAAAQGQWPLFLIPENLPAEADPTQFDEIALSYLQKRFEQVEFSAVLIGPGLGRSAATETAIWALILFCIERRLPVVLDADALYILSRRTPGLWPVSPQGQAMRGILTPHRGELERWLVPKGQTKDEPPQSTSKLAKIALAALPPLKTERAEEQVILCSGSTDELTGHNGRFAHCSGGFARMTCAGTGDLLAGLCASFLAQGMSPWAAARLGAYLLRQAGNLAAKDFGLGLVADDLPIYIAKVLAQQLASA